jgi:hypothetical protein
VRGRVFVLAALLACDDSAGLGEAPDPPDSGVFVPPVCNDGNPCTDDAWDSSAMACVFVVSTIACDDHNACTEADQCDEGRCVGRSIECDDGIACTIDACDPGIGCAPEPDHSACADQDPCTLDQCTASGCTNPFAEDGTICGDGVTCVTERVCAAHACVERPVEEGAACDDGNGCTVDDRCRGASCEGGRLDSVPLLLFETFMIDQAEWIVPVGDRFYVRTGVRGTTENLATIAVDRNDAAPEAVHGWERETAAIADNGGGLLVRSVIDTQLDSVIELYDVADVRRPVRLATVSGLGPVAGQIQVYDEALFACIDGELVGFDLSGRFVLLPTSLGPSSCNGIIAKAYERRGPIVAWVEAAAGPDRLLKVARAELGGLDSIFLAEPSTGAAPVSPFVSPSLVTDGHHVVFQDEGATIFVVDLDRAVPTLEWFSPSEPVHSLLAVEAGRLVVETDDGRVIAIDVTMPSAPLVLPAQITTPISTATLHAGVLFWTDFSARLRAAAVGPLGLVESIVVHGQGSLDRLYDDGARIVGMSPGGVTPIDPHTLDATPAGAPDTVPIPNDRPVWLDGDTGVLGVYVPLVSEPRECRPYDWFCGRRNFVWLDGRTNIGVDTTGGSVTTYDPFYEASGDQYATVAISGCIGGAVIRGPNGPSYNVVDRCRYPYLLREVPGAPVGAGGPSDDAVQAIAHDGHTTFLGQNRAELYDHGTSSTVSLGLTTPSGRDSVYLGAAYDGEHWVLVNARAGTPRFEVHDSSTVFVRAIDPAITPLRAMLLKWPDVYLAALEGEQGVVLAYDLTNNFPPRRVPIAGAAIDALEHDGLFYFARPDGLSVLTPGCGP